MRDQPTLRERWSYFLDKLFSRGTSAMILALGGVSLVIILIAGALIALGSIAPEGEEPLSFGEAVWQSLMRTLDAGTMGGDTGWGFRLIQFFVTLGGIFVISALIGVLSSAIEARLADLRKGRSRVLEQDHTVILGWSEQVFTIISELVTANESLPKSCIVVLAEKDKVEMEDEIREKVGSTGSTRVICRNGNPQEPVDLGIVNLNTARSIIVISTTADDADAEVIKTILAITNFRKQRPKPYHIVAELRDPRNESVAKVAGKGEVEFIIVGAYMSRIIAQTCRQSGLSTVYTELLNFSGDEIYFRHEPTLEGQLFSQALLAYEKCSVMGISDVNGLVQLCPAPQTRLRAGDKLVLVAADDNRIQVNAVDQVAAVDESLIYTALVTNAKPEQTLILGWNGRGSSIICELDNYVPPGSEVLVVAELPDAPEQFKARGKDLQHITATFVQGDTTDRRLLDTMVDQEFDHVILLSYSDSLSPQQADARTLMTLLHLRDICQLRRFTFSIVSEMLDIRNRNLAEVTEADDFIVSDKLVSLIMAQVSENKLLNTVFADLFDPQGAEIYLKPVARYVQPEQSVNFYTVVAAAARRGETAIGYRQRSHAHDSSRNYGVVINPAKSHQVRFTEHDSIIVLANE